MPLLRSQGNANVFVAAIAPQATQTGDQWNDISVSPPLIRVWSGSAWVSAISGTSTITVGGVTDTLQNFLVER